MACRFTYNGKTYDQDGLANALRDMPPNIAAKYIPTVKSIPDAPFVGNTDAWVGLTLKRMIRYAAENGYDKIAWTPGEVQAARYDLSKHISKIEYEPAGGWHIISPKNNIYGDRWLVKSRDYNSKGLEFKTEAEAKAALAEKQKSDPQKYEITATDHSGKKVIHEDEVPLSRIEELVGKDLAKKIEANEGEHTGGAYREWKTLSGLDLKVGGEGMVGFYDKMLPAAANKLVKKYGAKVGQSDLPVASKPLLNETETMVGRPNGIVKKSGGYSLTMEGSDITWGLFSSHGDAARRLADLQKAWDTTKTPVHTLDITPALRDAAMKQGFPQFSAGGRTKFRSVGGRIRLTKVEHDPFETQNAIRRAIHGYRGSKAGDHTRG